MSKGSSPSGTTTVVQNQTNPTQAVQLPFLTGNQGGPQGANTGWSQAINLAQFDPYQYYPNQTLATPDSTLVGGYQTLGGVGANILPQIAGAGNAAFNNGVNGGYSIANSPAYAQLQNLGNGYGAPNNQIGVLQDIGNQAGAGNATAMGQLGATANGAYLGANPYIAAEYKAAAQPVVNAYQTATAPQTDSNFEAAGRYGSGALSNAQSQNELNLGTTLGNLSANLYGQDYANERGLQNSAAGTLGQLQNQNLNTSANAYQAGGALQLGGLAQQLGALGGLQSGYQAGNTAANQALLMEPNVLSGNTAGANALVQGGTGLTGLNQASINDLMQRFYGNQQAPWQTNQAYLNQIGQPTSGSINSSTTSPYFTNGLANVLGAGLGGLGLYNGLNSATGGSLGSGLSSIFGGAGGGSYLSDAALASLAAGGAGLAGTAAGGFSAAGLGLLGGL